MKINIPENLLKKIIEDKANYDLSYQKMTDFLNSQGIEVSPDGLKKKLRREGLTD